MRNNYKHWFIYKLLVSKIQEWSVKMNPENEIRRVYYKIFHHYPDLNNPKNLIEKTYWLQLYTDTTLWTKCADKFRMREYVEECGLSGLLPTLFGHWEDPRLIDFDNLPKQFVLKTNNATETCIIVSDKKLLNREETINTLKKWLRVRFGYSGYQIHYSRIKPCVIAEELLIPDETQRVISPKSLIDYKVFCCDGEPICIWVAYNRDKEAGVDMNIYDTNWTSHPEWLHNMRHYNYKDVTIPEPSCLTDLLEHCRVLSKQFPQVRLDFYIIDGKPYIGELTFTSGYGFFTEEFYDYLGSKIDLSRVKRIGE